MEHETHVKRETPGVTAIRPGERVYYVEAVFMVPHKVMLAVPAPTTEAACNLAADIVARSKNYGIPDFDERGRVEVVSITSEGRADKDGASRFEPVPDRFKHKRFNVPVKIT